MIEQSCSTKYKVIKEDFLTKNEIKFSLVQNRYDANLPLYLMRVIKKIHFSNDEHFLSYARTKIINIIDPIDVFIRDDEYALVFRNMENFRYSEQKYKEEPYLTKIIFLQLSLTFAELSRKRIGWNIESLSQLYLQENWKVFLSIQDLDDSYFLQNIPQQKNVWNILLPVCFEQDDECLRNEQHQLGSLFFKNEPLYYIDRTEVLKELKGFDQIFNIKPTIQQTPLPENFPYQELIRIYFNPKIANQNILLQQLDEISYEVETPLIFQQNFGVQTKTIECRIYNDKQINQDREIEYQLLVKNCPLILSAFCYMRIQEEAIFFYEKKYFCSLQDAFNQPIQIDNEEYKNVAYKILNDILIAISYLHQFHIVHRNLNPKTCYLLDKELTKGNTYMLGNLGGSKIVQQQNIQVIDTQFNYNQDEQYMAPEDIENYSIKSDIFQFGILALYIMNRGKLPVQTIGLGKKEYSQNFSVQNLSNKLAPYNYPKELIKNISQCLEFEPQNRPNSKDLVNAIQKIYHGSKIKIISQSKLQK